MDKTNKQLVSEFLEAQASIREAQFKFTRKATRLVTKTVDGITQNVSVPVKDVCVLASGTLEAPPIGDCVLVKSSDGDLALWVLTEQHDDIYDNHGVQFHCYSGRRYAPKAK